MKLNQTNMVSVLSVAGGGLSERMRHAAAHLDDGERPEAVAMWFDVSLETVYSLMGGFNDICKGGE